LLNQIFRKINGDLHNYNCNYYWYAQGKQMLVTEIKEETQLFLVFSVSYVLP
jgi:hypothetical protein